MEAEQLSESEQVYKMNLEDLCAYIMQPEMKKNKKKTKKKRKDEKTNDSAARGESAEERSTSVDTTNLAVSSTSA